MTKKEQQAIADKALALAMNQINGVKGNKKPDVIKIGYLGEMKALNVPVISTGSLALDLALGTGGYPQGRIIEIFGPAASGKTTMCLHAIAETQKLGYRAAFIDIEHTLDTSYAQTLGVKTNQLLFSQPDDGDEAMRIIDMLVKTSLVKLIVVDSVASLVPAAEMAGEITDNHIGRQARLMSQALRRLTVLCNKTGTTILFTNQIRMKIGVIYGCFHYDTLVNFADGRSIPIGQVVDERIPGKVYCLNWDTKEIETKLITDWHDNGKITSSEDFINIQTESIDGGKGLDLTCTSNHLILTDSGLLKAKDISPKNRLISRYSKTLNGIYGCSKSKIRKVKIREIRNASSRQMRNKRKFDISVEDNQNYMVGGINNGVVVHNSPEVTSGGNALKFYASCRLDIRRKEAIKEGENIIGNSTQVKVVKNKLAPPFKKAFFNIIYGVGIDKGTDIVQAAVDVGVVERSGAWYSYNGDQIGQGITNATAFLLEDKKLLEEVRQRVLQTQEKENDSAE